MAFNDLLADRQADAGSGNLGTRVKPLKHLEDFRVILGRDADPFVFDGESENVALPNGGNGNGWRAAAAAIPKAVTRRRSTGGSSSTPSTVPGD